MEFHVSLPQGNGYDYSGSGGDRRPQMRHGGVFNQDFMDEVESLKEEASPYKQQLDEKGLQL